ncbi:MAG: hypothetical protein K5634_05425, partial [Sphaerochaetaceae bacterium]|nr:hypothetical protein [Sphaerochaetaceae bacterium]
MKKALIILLVSLFAVLSFVSCNVDATDGLADQVSNSAPSSNTRILQYLGTNDAGAFVIRAENGIYTITDGVITSNKVSNDIKSACMLKHTPVSTTEVKECIFTLDNDGDLNYYTMDDPSTIHDSYDGTYSYLDDNGFLMQKIDDDNGCYIYML